MTEFLKFVFPDSKRWIYFLIEQTFKVKKWKIICCSPWRDMPPPNPVWLLCSSAHLTSSCPLGRGEELVNIFIFLCQFLDVGGFKSEFLVLSQQKHLKILLVQVILLFKDKKKSTMLLLSNPPFM